MYSSNFQPESSLRWKRVQSVLQSINADAVLLNTNANLYYSSGRVFNGYTYIPSEGEAIYFVRRPIGLKGENVHYIHKPEQIPALLTEIGLPLPVSSQSSDVSTAISHGYPPYFPMQK